jgi:hypothetical protein
VCSKTEDSSQQMSPPVVTTFSSSDFIVHMVNRFTCFCVCSLISREFRETKIRSSIFIGSEWTDVCLNDTTSDAGGDGVQIGWEYFSKVTLSVVVQTVLKVGSCTVFH